MRYFLVAGEASGDLHASNLMSELKKQDPAAEFSFLGGDLMQAQGGFLVKHYMDMAFMGFWAVIKNLSKILNNLTAAKNTIVDFNPDVLILIDYPSFNLKLAKFAKQKLQIPVHYYISPKLWAWKEYRLKDIKLYVDKMYCIFPFEVEFYAKRGYKVDYVGNPTVDSIADFKKEMISVVDFRNQNKLDAKPIIAILAGSRKQEISACLGRMIASTEDFTDYQPVIAGAPGIDSDFYSSVLNGTKIQVVYGQTYDLLSHSTAALVNSGTATLETALIGTPQVVVYHVIFGRAAYAIKDFFIKVKFFSLVNLMAQKEVVKELVAHYFTIQNVRKELRKILTDKDYRDLILTEYEVLNKKLGLPGAAKRTAKRIYETINKNR